MLSVRFSENRCHTASSFQVTSGPRSHSGSDRVQPPILVVIQTLLAFTFKNRSQCADITPKRWVWQSMQLRADGFVHFGVSATKLAAPHSCRDFNVKHPFWDAVVPAFQAGAAGTTPMGGCTVWRSASAQPCRTSLSTAGAGPQAFSATEYIAYRPSAQRE